MGSVTTITLYASSADEAQEAFVKTFALISRLDSILSDYDPESELSRFCRSHTPPGKELKAVMEFAQRLARETSGAFDITAGALTHLWRQARKEQRVPTPEEIRGAMERVGYRHLQGANCAVANMQLDAGGIAKGYAADRALSGLRQLGIRSALVAMSGDIAVGDPPPGKPGWKVEVGGQVLTLRNKGVSTSGDEVQHLDVGGIRYSHIIDPRTGWALRNSHRVAVMAKTAMEADAIATAVSVGGPETAASLKKNHDVEILLAP